MLRLPHYQKEEVLKLLLLLLLCVFIGRRSMELIQRDRQVSKLCDTDKFWTLVLRVYDPPRDPLYCCKRPEGAPGEV